MRKAKRVSDENFMRYCHSTYCERNKKMQQNANKTRDLVISSSALVSEKSSSQWKLDSSLFNHAKMFAVS